ncbi:MAG: O-acetyl-ADP-ribose deacetylase [Candidatus Eremiobacteraeota bacterium]|nr:O-acetyl-ADP-ribose deacetylase [Candidatus Eremiobacteraeota bacterium]
MKERRIGDRTLRLTVADITTLQVDAIVNAANAALAGGGGVDGAIHRAGGPAIAQACRAIGGCPTGSAVITPAGNLRARYIIHAVAPRYSAKPRDAEQLEAAYRRSLELAREHVVRTIAFPSLGTGAYRYPIDEAASIALATVVQHLQGDTTIDTATFALFSDADRDAYARALDAL